MNKEIYLTEFEKQILESIENKEVVQYSDYESFKIFESINKGVVKVYKGEYYPSLISS